MGVDVSMHAALGDDELLAEIERLALEERRATARLVAALAEVDARRLYLGQGCASLFVYCTRVLKLSEHAAYNRIEAARAARRLPMLLACVERGELTLTTLRLLAPHLTHANAEQLLQRARGRSKRDVEEIVASLRPQADGAPFVRKLPDRGVHRTLGPATARADVPGSPPSAAAATAAADEPPVFVHGQKAAPRPPDHLQPIAPARYRLQVTIDQRTADKLRHARDLMRHVNPSGDLDQVLDRALDLLVAHLERSRHGWAVRPRAVRASRGSRHIPSAVRRAVWRRDGGRCAFVGAAGRCGETGFLEYHHVQPYADHGPATVENIQLRCRAHNQYEAALVFGDLADGTRDDLADGTRGSPGRGSKAG